MSDINCPYCDRDQYIRHDDGYGYTEDETFEQVCSDCGKAFAYTTSIHFYYEAKMAKCLNGGAHKWNSKFASKHFPDARYCEACGKDQRGKYAANAKEQQSLGRGE